MNPKIEGYYQINGDSLINQNNKLTLKVGYRHRPKKGQAQRFLGYVDPAKQSPDNYTYISSLYSTQGSKNKYRLDYNKAEYDLVVTALNQVVIQKAEPVIPLSYEPEKGSMQEQINKAVAQENQALGYVEGVS